MHRHAVLGVKRARTRSGARRMREASPLLHADILGLVLRAWTACERYIEELLRLQLVSRGWHSAVALALADEEWLAPFLASAARLSKEAARMLPQMADMVPWAQMDPPLRASFWDDVGLHTFDCAAQCEALDVLCFVVPDLRAGGISLRRVLALAFRACGAHPLCVRIRNTACRIVAAVAGEAGGHEALCNARAVELLVGLLARVGPCWQAADALRACVAENNRGSRRNASAVVQAGGVAVLLGAMRGHPLEHDFLVAGFACCSALTHYQHVDDVVRAGSAELVFAAMQRFAGRASMQTAGMRLLAAIEEKRPRPRVDYMARSCGLQTVLAGARCFCGDGETDRQFLRFVGELANNPDTPPGVATFEVVSLVLRMLDIARAQDRRTLACSTLARLSARFPREVAATDAGARMLAVMLESLHSREMQDAACIVLANVSFPRGASRRAVAAPGMVQGVMRALKASYYRVHVPGIEVGLEALLAIMASRRNVAEVEELHGVHIALACLRDLTFHRKVCERALLVLLCLAQHRDARADMREHKALRLCITVFGTHLSFKLRSRALELMAILVRGSVSLQTFFRDRHPPELLEAWADPALQRAAREILRVCAPQALASVVG